MNHEATPLSDDEATATTLTEADRATNVDLEGDVNTSEGGQLLNGWSNAKLFWVLVAVASLPFLVPYFLAAFNQEHFQYIPLVPVAILGLAYSRHDGILVPPQGRLNWILFGTGLAIVALAAYLHSSWLGAIGSGLWLIVFLRSLKQSDGSSLTYLAVPLLLFIRLPQLRTQALIVRLQRVTTELASVVLDRAGVPNEVQGNTISLASKQLFVDEACSGVRSLFTLMFFALVLLIYRQRSVYLTPLMLAVGIALAIFGNLIRVTTIALAEAWFGYDLASGFAHDLLGHGTLLLSLALMLSADRLVEAIFHPMPQMEDIRNPLILGWNGLFGSQGQANERRSFRLNEQRRWSSFNRNTLLALGGVLIVLASWMTLSKLVDRNGPTLAGDGELLFEPSEDLVQIDDIPITLVNHQIYRNSDAQQNLRLGKNADIYTCNVAKRPGEIVVSQPYVGWHELTVCYQATGWTLVTRKEVRLDGQPPVVMAQFKKDGTLGYLFFTAVNADGTVPVSLGDSRIAKWLTPFVPTILDDLAETSGVGQTAMVQYWMVTDVELSRDETETIVRSMMKVRSKTGQQMMATNT